MRSSLRRYAFTLSLTGVLLGALPAAHAAARPLAMPLDTWTATVLGSQSPRPEVGALLVLGTWGTLTAAYCAGRALRGPGRRRPVSARTNGGAPVPQTTALRGLPEAAVGDTPRRRVTKGAATGAPPARRAATATAALTATFPEPPPAAAAAGSASTFEHAPLLDASTPMDRLELANLLARAWRDRDADVLAAAARAEPDAARAGWVLAAAAAVGHGDPRAHGYLQEAFLHEDVLEQDDFLRPFIGQLRFEVPLPAMKARHPLGCSREAIGCVLASAELAALDPEGAYSVLLTLPGSPPVSALTAQAALNMGWNDKAAAAAASGLAALATAASHAAGSSTGVEMSAPGMVDRSRGADTALRACLHLLASRAHNLQGDPDDAAAHAGACLRVVDSTAASAGDGPTEDLGDVVVAARLELAAALAGQGRTDDAWSELTAVLAADPDCDSARELLKTL